MSDQPTPSGSEPAEGSGDGWTLAGPVVDQAPRRAGSRADRDIFGRRPTKTSDWSHRRGEPRVFALIWTAFLMGITLLLFAKAGIGGPTSPENFRPAVRLALWLMLAGVCLFWPGIRLSQLFPARSATTASLKDFVIIAIPSQALVWPQAWLCRWPLEVVAAIAVCVTVWASLVGAVLAMAGAAAVRRMSPGTGRGRVPAMLVCVAFVAVGAAFALAGPAGAAGDSGFRPAWMWSPMTSVAEMTADRSWTGQSAAVTGSHWRVLGGLGLASVVMWAAAAAFEGLGGERGKP